MYTDGVLANMNGVLAILGSYTWSAPVDLRATPVRPFLEHHVANCTCGNIVEVTSTVATEEET